MQKYSQRSILRGWKAQVDFAAANVNVESCGFQFQDKTACKGRTLHPFSQEIRQLKFFYVRYDIVQDELFSLKIYWFGSNGPVFKLNWYNCKDI